MLRFCLIGCLFIMGLLSVAYADEAPAEGEAVQSVPGGTEFALNLYRKIAAEHEGENIFISPFSVRSALAMTWEGARGQTADEMAEALRLPDIDRPQVHAGFGGMTRVLNADNRPYEFGVANALWLEQTFPFEQAYLRQITDVYGASLHQADFIHEYEAEREAINRWVEDQTQEKIKDLMPEGTVTGDTRQVLANAVYFKGQWVAKFDPEQTRDGAFRLIDGTEVQVPMMTRTNAEISMGAGDGFAAVELPYVGEVLSMVILLPTRKSDFTTMESQLTPEAIDTTLSHLSQPKLHRPVLNLFQMPKFKIETDSYWLNDILKSMGMKLAFEGNRADFMGMSPYGKQLYISDVMHKGFVDVNEEGTEAAAATGVGAAAVSFTMWEINRPFLFLIRHRPTGEILFLGRVLDPREP